MNFPGHPGPPGQSLKKLWKISGMMQQMSGHAPGHSIFKPGHPGQEARNPANTKTARPGTNRARDEDRATFRSIQAIEKQHKTR
jgi:hypothetical protein